MGSRIITDEFKSYKSLKHFYKHESVNHSAKEYVRNDVYTNTTEGYFSFVKRTINGTWHWVSTKHLNSYLNEINYRYNNRSASQNQKFSCFLDNTRGRLRYKNLIAK